MSRGLVTSSPLPNPGSSQLNTTWHRLQRRYPADGRTALDSLDSLGRRRYSLLERSVKAPSGDLVGWIDPQELRRDSMRPEPSNRLRALNTDEPPPAGARGAAGHVDAGAA